MTLSRGATPQLLETLKGHFHPVLLTYADWAGTPIRIHSGGGDISWDGHTWLGRGALVQFNAPEETSGLATSEGTVRVAASLEDMLAQIGVPIRNLPIKVWFSTTTKAGGNVLNNTPVELFTGYFDSRTGSLSRQVENLSHDMVLGLGIGPSARASASITHNYEDQITKFPGDTAGRHVQNAIKGRYIGQRWPGSD